MTCCMCADPHTGGTPIIDGESFCRHLEMWLKTPEDIQLREWTRRVLYGTTEHGVRAVVFHV